MTSASALTDGAALLLFQNLREGMQNGRIVDLNTALTEVDAAIAKLNSGCLPEEPTHTNDLIAKLFLELGSVKEKVTKCEAQLADFQPQAKVLNEDAIRIVARTEASDLLTEYQKKILAAMEEITTSEPPTLPPRAGPLPSLADTVNAYTMPPVYEAAFPSLAHASNVPALSHPWVVSSVSPAEPTPRPAPSRAAVVSFPGGPRTVTIHPPDSPGYQSIIRDEGNVIIEFKRPKRLCREGAFRGPIEEIDWRDITRVYGRAPGQSGVPDVPPGLRWPDPSQPSYLRTLSCGPSDIIARQRQLSTSMKTDSFGRVLPPEYPRSPSLLTGMSFSSLPPSSQVFQFSSSTELSGPSTSPSTPPSPSPSDGRNKKRTRNGDDDESVPATSNTAREEPSLLLANPQTVKKPVTPMPAKREESRPPEGPGRRKKLRPSASSEGLSTPAVSPAGSVLDLTHTD